MAKFQRFSVNCFLPLIPDIGAKPVKYLHNMQIYITLKLSSISVSVCSPFRQFSTPTYHSSLTNEKAPFRGLFCLCCFRKARTHPPKKSNITVNNNRTDRRIHSAVGLFLYLIFDRFSATSITDANAISVCFLHFAEALFLLF